MNALTGRRPDTTLEDISAGMRLATLWRDMAFEDIVQRYRRSYLGMAWVVIGYLLFVGIVGIIFHRGLSEGFTFSQYVAYLAIGYWCWMYIQSCVSEGMNSISGSAGFAKGSALPLSLLFYRVVCRNTILSGVMVLGLCGFLVYTQSILDVRILFVLIAIPIYWIAGFFTAMLLGSAAAQLPDLGHAVQSLMRMMFFMTPIIWTPSDQGGARDLFAKYNPFSYFIAIMRKPLMGDIPSLQDYAVVFGTMLILMILAVTVFHLIRRTISLSL